MWTKQGEIREYEHTGTVFGAINKRQFEELKLVDPGSGLIEAFEATVGPIDAQVRRNSAETRTLTSLRDALLPKLITGAVRVEQFPELT